MTEKPEPLKGKGIDSERWQYFSNAPGKMISVRNFEEKDVRSAVEWLMEKLSGYPNPMGLMDRIREDINTAFPDVLDKDGEKG